MLKVTYGEITNKLKKLKKDAVIEFSTKRSTYLIAEIVGRCEYHTSKISASFSILTTEEISNEKQK